MLAMSAARADHGSAASSPAHIALSVDATLLGEQQQALPSEVSHMDSPIHVHSDPPSPKSPKSPVFHDNVLDIVHEHPPPAELSIPTILHSTQQEDAQRPSIDVQLAPMTPAGRVHTHSQAHPHSRIVGIEMPAWNPIHSAEQIGAHGAHGPGSPGLGLGLGPGAGPPSPSSFPRSADYWLSLSDDQLLHEVFDPSSALTMAEAMRIPWPRERLRKVVEAFSVEKMPVLVEKRCGVRSALFVAVVCVLACACSVSAVLVVPRLTLLLACVMRCAAEPQATNRKRTPLSSH